MGNKYGAVRTTIDGVSFHSKSEARHYVELRLRERAGEIRNLTLQRPFVLSTNGKKVGLYICDFDYDDVRLGRHVFIDVKGVLTPLYRWKKRHMLAEHGIRLQEVKA